MLSISAKSFVVGSIGLIASTSGSALMYFSKELSWKTVSPQVKQVDSHTVEAFCNIGLSLLYTGLTLVVVASIAWLFYPYNRSST